MKKTIVIAVIAVFMSGCYYNQQSAQDFDRAAYEIKTLNQRQYYQNQAWLQQQRQEQERLDRINQQNNLIFELQKMNQNLDNLNRPVQAPIQAPQVKW